MINDPVLINDWHPVARTIDVDSQKIKSLRLLGEDIVLCESGENDLAWQDLCIHRGGEAFRREDQRGKRPFRSAALNGPGSLISARALSTWSQTFQSKTPCTRSFSK